jgi:LPXTG-motif cell wall-anchored protein
MGNTGMSQAMIIALALIVLGIILGIIFYKQRNKP